MMQSCSFPIAELIVARLDVGDDVLLSIKKIVEEHTVTAGMFILIGAVDRLKIGYYDPAKRTYRIYSWKPGVLQPRAQEILSCVGNVAQLDGETVIHGHITLKGLRTYTIGGHLLEGCRVFPTAELTLLKASGVLARRMDKSLNLALLSL